MISIGSTGTARQNRLTRPRHVRRVDGLTGHLEREIGFHARAHVEIAVMHERPAAMGALNAPQIIGDLGFERSVYRLGQMMTKQHIFGRDRAIGFELEHPVAIRLLATQQSARRLVDARIEGAARFKSDLADCGMHVA